MYKGLKNVVLKSARIDVKVRNKIACTACTTVIRIIDATSAGLVVLRMVVNCFLLAICCAVPTIVRIDWWMALHCARIAICCAVSGDVRID